jgi:hypothetical protein
MKVAVTFAKNITTDFIIVIIIILSLLVRALILS